MTTWRERKFTTMAIVATIAVFILMLIYHTFVSPFTWTGITPLFSTFTFVVVLAGGGSLVWYLGVKEQAQHKHNIEQIPIRVHVNGIRGKSTTTRLIGGALREGKIRTMTKTTGKAARLIGPDAEETPIIRDVSPNIREQVDIIEQAVEDDIDSLVIECMAVQPELQRVAEHKMVNATIGVITNIRPDHIDVLGPTLHDIAKNIANTVPENGVLITAERKYLSVFEEKAAELNTEVILVDPEEIDDATMDKFSYLNFKENVAIALEVARQLDIPEKVALRGMIKAKPGPGLMTIEQTVINGSKFTFINAFGVNDKDSTIMVFEELKRQGYFPDHAVLVGLFHARGDRVSRTVDFGQAMGEEMEFDRIVLCGSMTNHFTVNAGKAGYRIDRIEDLGRVTGGKLVDHMADLAKKHDDVGFDTVYFGFGNMVGPIPKELLNRVNQGSVRMLEGGEAA